MLHLQLYFNIEILLDIYVTLRTRCCISTKCWGFNDERSLRKDMELWLSHVATSSYLFSALKQRCVHVPDGNCRWILYSMTWLGQRCPVNVVACCCDVGSPLNWFRKKYIWYQQYWANIVAALRKKTPPTPIDWLIQRGVLPGPRTMKDFCLKSKV